MDDKPDDDVRWYKAQDDFDLPPVPPAPPPMRTVRDGCPVIGVSLVVAVLIVLWAVL